MRGDEDDHGTNVIRLTGLSRRLYRRRFWLIADVLNFFALVSIGREEVFERRPALWPAILETTAQPVPFTTLFRILKIFPLQMVIPVAVAYTLWHEGKNAAAVFE